MCIRNLRVKRQWLVTKKRFAYKVLKRDEHGNLSTTIVGKSVINSTHVWQGAYKKMPQKVRKLLAETLGEYQDTYEGKVGVILDKQKAIDWVDTHDEEVWLVKIKYDQLLVGDRTHALVDEYRLVECIFSGEELHHD